MGISGTVVREGTPTVSSGDLFTFLLAIDCCQARGSVAGSLIRADGLGPCIRSFTKPRAPDLEMECSDGRCVEHEKTGRKSRYGTGSGRHSVSQVLMADSSNARINFCHPTMTMNA